MALNSANGFQTSATVDGWVFPQDVMAIFKSGKQNDVPVIIGSNANEGSIFTQESVTGDSFRPSSAGSDLLAFVCRETIRSWRSFLDQGA